MHHHSWIVLSLLSVGGLRCAEHSPAAGSFDATPALNGDTGVDSVADASAAPALTDVAREAGTGGGSTDAGSGCGSSPRTLGASFACLWAEPAVTLTSLISFSLEVSGKLTAEVPRPAGGPAPYFVCTGHDTHRYFSVEDATGRRFVVGYNAGAEGQLLLPIPTLSALDGKQVTLRFRGAGTIIPRIGFAVSDAQGTVFALEQGLGVSALAPTDVPEVKVKADSAQCTHEEACGRYDDVSLEISGTTRATVAPWATGSLTVGSTTYKARNLGSTRWQRTNRCAEIADVTAWALWRGDVTEAASCEPIPGDLLGATCVIGSPGGACGDISTPATCRDGRWECPPGMTPPRTCRPARDR